MHHELAHTLYSHLAAIFGDHEPIAIEPPAEQSDEDEPLREDSHSKSDGADSARTAEIVEGKDIEGAGAAARVAHDTDRDNDYTISLTSELERTDIHDRKPSSITPTGIPIIPGTPSTNNMLNYPKDLGDPPNVPDGMSRGDIQETAVNGGQWQRTACEVNRNDEMASPAPNTADRTSEMATGDSPVPLSRTRPKIAVKHQHKSTRNIPRPDGRANAITQRSDGHPKPIVHLPKRHRLPLEGERHVRAANGHTHSSSGRSMPQKLAHAPNESKALITISIESENPVSGEIPRVHLASMHWHTDDVNCLGSGADALNGQADESKDSADALNASNNAETAGMSNGEGAHTLLGAGGTKCAVDSANGLGSQTEMSEGQADLSRAQTDTLNMSNGAGTGSISCRDGAETYLGVLDTKRAVDETDSLGGHADASNGHTDAHSVETDARKPETAQEHVRHTRIELKRPDSPSGDAKHAVDETDGIGSHADASSGHRDALNALNNAGIGGISNGDEPTTYLGAGDAKRGVDATDGFGSRMDTSSGLTDVPSVQTDARTTTNAPQIVRTPRKRSKRPNSPVETEQRHSDHPNGLGNRADTSSSRTNVQSVGNDALTAANAQQSVRTRPRNSKPPDLPGEGARWTPHEPNACGSPTDTSSMCTDTRSVEIHPLTPTNGMERVKTRQTDSKTRNSPYTRETATPKPAYQWKQVSLRGINVHVPQIRPIDTTNRMFVFGRAESAGEAVVARIVDETTGDGDGNRNGGDGDVHGTTSSGHIHSRRAEKALLAADSQHTRSSQVSRRYNSPVPPRPPIQSADRPYGPARHQRRRRKLKIERINDKSISQTPEVETTHLQRGRFAQPRENPSRRCWKVHRPTCQHGTLKIERINVSRTPRAETTHLTRTHAAQPHGNPSKRFHRVHTPIRRRDPIKIAPTNVSQAPEDEGTHLGRDPITQPRGDDPKHSYRVIGPRRRRGRLKTRPTNVSRKRKERKCLPRALQAHTPPPTPSIRSHAIRVHRKSSIRPSELEERPAKRLAATTRSLIASNTHLSANGSTTRNALIADT